MICAIVLAAGQSRRMGAHGQKLLLPFGGGTVISHVVDEILRGPVDRTFVVVSGKDSARIIGTLGGRPLTVVANPDADGDMLSSIRCGLRALPAECQAVLLALGDQPAITAGLVARMLDAYRTAGRGILVPVHSGRRGHPLLFAARYAPEILAGGAAYDQAGLRALLTAHPQDVFELPAPESGAAVLADMDCPEDYQRELARRKDSLLQRGLAGGGRADSRRR